ncbi:MAG: RNA methyltransferase [Firmicutes bacterium]|nr:RNA methyltransferase [Bacillota bacterium]
MVIESLQNKNVKYWVSLHKKKNRDLEQKFLIEGDHLIQEAKKYGIVLETISLNDEFADYLVNEKIMKKISQQKSIPNNIAVCSYLKEREIKGKVLLLDDLQDPGNLGTIIRSAVAFNFETIILSKESCDKYNEKVIRATEGYLFKINIIRKNLLEVIDILKKDNYQIIGTDVIKGKDIKKLSFKKIALIIGNEGRGMNQNIKSKCDDFVKIAMNNDCESLNAGVAASILMYEVNK